jgi:hypothetical protein
VYSSPALGDIDGDGMVEVVVGSDDNNVYALYGSDGAMKWSFKTGDWVYSSPALGDIDGDGRVEVVVGSFDRYVYALNGSDGTMKWSFKADFVIMYSSPALGDIDGDGMVEVVVGSHDSNVYALNGYNGGKKWSFKITDFGAESFPALGDIDSDGMVEVVVGCRDSNVYALDGDSVPPTCEIIRPVDYTIYWNDVEKGTWDREEPLIIGQITIRVKADDKESGIDRVEINVHHIKGVDRFTIYQPPFEHKYTNFRFGLCSIEAIAYDKAGLSATDIKTMWKFL